MGSRRAWIGFSVALLAAAAWIGWWWSRRTTPAAAPGAPVAATTAPVASRSADLPATPSAAAIPAAEIPIADATAYSELNDERRPPLNDLRIVSGLLQNYQSSLKSAAVPPLGFNEEIVRALTGANPLGVAFLPSSHRSINAAGLWCDRWGTPYQFHPLSAELMEVRSAGADRRLYTADDLVLSPRSENAVLR